MKKLTPKDSNVRMLVLTKNQFNSMYIIEGEKMEKEIVQDGGVKEYYESGELQLESNYIDGKLSGTYTKYYENGNLKIEKIYSKDKLNLGVTEYFEDRKIELESSYTNGKLDKSLGKKIAPTLIKLIIKLVIIGVVVYFFKNR